MQRLGHIELAGGVGILCVPHEHAVEPHVDRRRRTVEGQTHALPAGQRLAHAIIGSERTPVQCDQIVCGNGGCLRIFMAIPRILDVHILRTHEPLHLQTPRHLHTGEVAIGEAARCEFRRKVGVLPMLIQALRGEPIQVRGHHLHRPFAVEVLLQRAGLIVGAIVVGMPRQPVDREHTGIGQPRRRRLFGSQSSISGRHIIARGSVAFSSATSCKVSSFIVAPDSHLTAAPTLVPSALYFGVLRNSKLFTNITQQEFSTLRNLFIDRHSHRKSIYP